MTVATQLTLFRIILIPLLIVVYYLPFEWRFLLSSAIFLVAAITDWADGYIARKYDQSTDFGAFLDPVADKLMVAVALVLLVEAHASPAFALPAMIIICREIVISALREWMAELGKRASVAVSYVGKIKTTMQMIAIIVLLAFDPNSVGWLRWAVELGYVLLCVAAALTLWSMFIYLRAAWPSLMEDEKQAGKRKEHG